MRGVCGWDVLRCSEVPQQALTRRLGQEGTAVLALAPAHAIRILEQGVPTVEGEGGLAKLQAD